MRISDYRAVLNSGTVIGPDMAPGTALTWETLHWSHNPNRLEKNHVEIREREGVTLLEVDIALGLQPFTETMAFGEINPLAITLELEADSDILAYYYFKDWWTRPAFVSSFDAVPQETAILFYRQGGLYRCLLALPGDRFRAHFEGGSGRADTVRLVLSADGAGYREIHETAMLAASDPDPYRCMEKAMERAAKLYGIPLREERPFPALFEKLGWCSWDAFYQDISEAGMLEKAEEIREKQLPFGWMLIDDGWQDYVDERMKSYGSNPEKFPSGLKGCVDKIRETCGIEKIGVWHAFSGYWCGIDPEGDLAKEHPDLFMSTHQGKLLPKPEKAEAFYGEWYRRLAEAGISFVKVDSQSSTRQHYRTNTPTGRTAAALHQGLDRAAEKYMGGNLINCMGMAMEDVLQRPSSALSRNSDDFFPMEEKSFREHLLENAFNCPWHNVIYHGDWDMFWSNHPQAEKHALLRALSGGPIYVSDRVGETAPEVLRPLCYDDGSILRADRGAVPTIDCLLIDPEKSGYLKLQNVCRGVGYLAVYSCDEKGCTAPMRVGDISRLSPEAGRACAVWSPTLSSGFRAEKDTVWDCSLPGDGYCLYQLAPIENGVAVFGRADKYLSSHAIQSISREGGALTVRLREAGPVLIYSEKRPECSGPLTLRGAGSEGFYIIDTPEPAFTLSGI